MASVVASGKSAGVGRSSRLRMKVNRISLGFCLAVSSHDDVNVVAQLRQHTHQSFDRHVTKLPAQKARDIGLAEPDAFGGLDLRQLAFADDLSQARVDKNPKR